MVMNKKIHSENKEHTFDETHNDSSVETEQTRQNDNINNTTNDLPEGGWGWLIVISSVVIHFIVAGLNRAAGILYLRFTDKFEKPASITAWVTSLSVSLTLGVGPVASVLCERYSYRKVVVAGGCILSISMIISGLSPNLYVLFASYGVMGGIGKAFAYGPGVVIVGLYFKKRRSLAVGIATSGVALGAFAIPSIVEISFGEYGYFGAFLFMAGVSLQMVVCGFLLRSYLLHRELLNHTERKRTQIKTEYGTIEKNERNHMKRHNAHVPIQDKTKAERYNRSNSLDKQANILNKTRMNNGDKMKRFDIQALKNIRFFGLCMAILFYNIAFQSAMIFLPALSETVGIGYFEAFPVVVVGICDGLGRIISGFFFDLQCIVPLRIYIYNFGLFALGVLTLIIPFVKTVVQLGVACAVFGLFLGNGVSQQSVIIIDIIGEHKLSNGFGILLFFQGIGTFVGPPISGLMKDINGTYDYAFYLGAVCAFIGSVIFFGANLVQRKLTNQTYLVS